MVVTAKEDTPSINVIVPRRSEDFMCLLFKMVDGVQVVCRLQTPLTSTENRPRANRMARVDPGPIKSITSRVRECYSCELHREHKGLIRWRI